PHAARARRQRRVGGRPGARGSVVEADRQADQYTGTHRLRVVGAALARRRLCPVRGCPDRGDAAMMKVTLTSEADALKPLTSAASAVAAPRVYASSRFADYLELTKPRIAAMALFTVAAGYLLGAGASAEVRVLFHTLLGAGLVAAGGSALNQLFERKIDARMNRTRKR